MILLFFDLEASGLDVETNRPLEVGAILYSTGQNRILESSGYLVKADVPITAEITKLTGITAAALEKFGYDSETALENLLDLIKLSDAIVGQNVIRFDKRVLENWARRHNMVVPNKLWIDTYVDLPSTVEPKSLKYLAADHGFLPSNSHAALADCETVLRIIQQHPLDVIVERAKDTTVVLKAEVSYETNKLAKDRRYRWNNPNKMWWKAFKSADVVKERQEAPFNIEVVDIPLEALWHS
jgi:DNA polymerase III epsilon subunit-like protein